MTRPRKGAPITVVGLGHIIRRLYVSSVRRGIPVAAEEYPLLAEEEGITWIRGHHRDGSKHARALLTAFALRT